MVRDSYGVDTVVNLWSKIDPDLSPEALGLTYINWHTSPSDVPADWREMVSFLTAWLHRGHTLLVHCEAGRGRSVWLCGWLLRTFEGLTGPEALARLEGLINHNLTPTLRAHLLEATLWSKE